MATRLFFIFIAGTWSMFALPAQTDTLFLDISQAQQLALQHHSVYQNYLLEGKISEKKLAAAQAKLYPQFISSFDLRYNIERPITLLPGESVGRPGEVIVRQLGPDLAFVPSFDLNQVVYDPELLTELKILKTSAQTPALLAEVAAIEAKYDVTLNYLNLLLSRAKTELLTLTRIRRESLFGEIQSKVLAGFIHKIELDKVQLLIDDTASEITQAYMAEGFYEYLLRWQLGIPDERLLILTEKPGIPDNLSDDYAEQMDLSPDDPSQLPDLRLHSLQTTLLKLKIGQEEKSVLPSASLYGHLGVVALGKEFSEADNDRLSFYFNSYIGVRAQWRLNSLIDKNRNLPQLQLQLLQQEGRLQELLLRNQIEVLQAKIELAQSYENFRKAQRNEAFALQEQAYLETRYANDLVTTGEILAAEIRRAEAEQATLIAYYQYLLARLRLTKAGGELK